MWHSALFDVVVKAISCSVGRSLHIYYSKLVLRGEPVPRVVIQASDQAMPGQPLALMHALGDWARPLRRSHLKVKFLVLDK
jgi:hypothetical protein